MMRNMKIRFAVIITSLAALVFSMLLGVNCLYGQYWSERQAYQTVKQAAGLAEQSFSGNGREEPLMFVVADKSGNLVSKYQTGQTQYAFPDDERIKLLLASDQDKWRAGSFVYYREKMPDGRTLLALTNSRYYKKQSRWLVTSAVISAGETVLIAPVSYCLYRYVGIPVRRSKRKNRQFLSDASHELKTMIGTIAINAQAVETQIGENLHVRNIQAETERMSRLSERLLTLFRIEEQEIDLTHKFSFSAAAMEVLLSYESAAYEKNLDYDYEVEERIELPGDEDEIRQLVALLLENAVKYTNENGFLRVRLRRHMGHVVLEVTNSGEGIGIADLPYIFDRFYTKARHEDSHSFGLGLAIAKAITEKHGGTITAESKKGKTTTFRVSF